ncbi:hypothetical protein CONCODRAFT_87685 [Conidiobolus coronatus NRRL 28638]|uniref:Uncharacterized protein n=1 Tax=Conidiobolus coronatus (strain ATCC 28846 / CBS 209.66 / NRRL 28638) TaxID=796925 RepID=A0A137NSW5_CONC2|nr:hypothetical protein CONCODRAFT_87685 [Conidiobolus coronatus NRRL 28638]|eukprot:KXN65865.1 hypothetical protein CONCODRAFT_87685 [Conidiobolus coronatus NRRL 28638]
MSYPCDKTLKINKTTIEAAAIDCSEKITHCTTEQVASQAWTSTFRAPSVASPQTIKPSLVDQFYAKYNESHAYSSIPTNPFKLGIFQNVTKSCLSINLTPTITFSLTSSVTHFTQSYAQDTQATHSCQNYNLSVIANASSNKSLDLIPFQVRKFPISAPNDSQINTAVSFQKIQSSALALRQSGQVSIHQGHLHFPPLNIARPSIYNIAQGVYQSSQVTFSISLATQFIQPHSIDIHEDILPLSYAIHSQTPYTPECVSKNKLASIGHHSWLSTIHALTTRQIPAANNSQSIQCISRKNEIRNYQINYKAALDYIFGLIQAYINQEPSHTSRVSQVKQSFTLSIQAEFFQNNLEFTPNIILGQIGISINQSSCPTLSFSQAFQFTYSCSQIYIRHDMLSIESAFHSNYTLPPQLSTTYSLLTYTFEYPSYNPNLLDVSTSHLSSRLLINESTSTYPNSEPLAHNLISEPCVPNTNNSIPNSSISKSSLQNPVPESCVPRILITNPKLPKLISSLFNHRSRAPTVSTTLELAYGEFI